MKTRICYAIYDSHVRTRTWGSVAQLDNASVYGTEDCRYSINHLYRVDWTVISGGFIAGDGWTINRFYRFYQKTFLEMLDSGRIDDDQTVLTLMLKHYGSLFNAVHADGDWYALFRLFPCSK
ncbi:unnamed protein product [Gongylonema pulchrum]|uniref:Metallophos domain-containing protein n=1 Tax=Gongylonema pulchrum TaxID=637853 RepID=A0A183DT91_9BILA|nr:unnamed protein product [Gongylonema pulchrum]